MVTQMRRMPIPTCSGVNLTMAERTLTRMRGCRPHMYWNKMFRRYSNSGYSSSRACNNCLDSNLYMVDHLNSLGNIILLSINFWCKFCQFDSFSSFGLDYCDSLRVEFVVGAGLDVEQAEAHQIWQDCPRPAKIGGKSCNSHGSIDWGFFRRSIQIFNFVLFSLSTQVAAY